MRLPTPALRRTVRPRNQDSHRSIGLPSDRRNRKLAAAITTKSPNAEPPYISTGRQKLAARLCEAAPIKPPFLRRIDMLRKTLVALAATGSLAVGAAALTPAMANYDRCYENPAATGCRATTMSPRSPSTWRHIVTRERRMSRAMRRVTTCEPIHRQSMRGWRDPSRYANPPGRARDPSCSRGHKRSQGRARRPQI